MLGGETDVLGLLGSYFVDLSTVELETSLQILPGTVSDRGRFCVWLDGAKPNDFSPIFDVLTAIAAPGEVLLHQRRAAKYPYRQAIGVQFSSTGTLNWRLYIHQRFPDLRRERRSSLRWNHGCSKVEESLYEYSFFPMDIRGRSPEDFVPAHLKSVVLSLRNLPYCSQLSGFFVRWDGNVRSRRLAQLDLAFPWYPLFGTLLPSLRALLPTYGLACKDLDRWSELPVRHLALSLSKPGITIYLSGRASRWPNSGTELQSVIVDSAALKAAKMSRLLGSVPPPPASAGGAVGSFYDGKPEVWRRVLGEHLHYHGGLFPDPSLRSVEDSTLETAMAEAVRCLYPWVPRGSRVYDMGCGWGGAAVLLAREHGCRVTGITASKSQYFYCGRKLGFQARLGDIEKTLPPGVFDVALLMESFSHIKDKLTALQRIRLFCRRLVMVVNCQDAGNPGAVFAGTMHMVSSRTLKSILLQAGWRIIHWKDRRRSAMPSVFAWHERLLRLSPTKDAHLETLRDWTTRVVEVAETWGRLNPLIEVVAVPEPDLASGGLF